MVDGADADGPDQAILDMTQTILDRTQTILDRKWTILDREMYYFRPENGW